MERSSEIFMVEVEEGGRWGTNNERGGTKREAWCFDAQPEMDRQPWQRRNPANTKRPITETRVKHACTDSHPSIFRQPSGSKSIAAATG